VIQEIERIRATSIRALGGGIAPCADPGRRPTVLGKPDIGLGRMSGDLSPSPFFAVMHSFT